MYIILLLIIFATACERVTSIGIRSSIEAQQEHSNQTIDINKVNMELITAASLGNVYSITRSLEQGADVNTSDANGVTPLIAAAYKNQARQRRY